MKLNYTFKHLDHSDSLVAYTEERMTEIEQFLLKEGYGNVYFSKQKNEFCVEASINTRQKYFKATAYGTDRLCLCYRCHCGKNFEKQFLKSSKQLKNHKNQSSPKKVVWSRSRDWRKAA